MRILMKALLIGWLAQANVFAGMVDPTKPPAAVMEYLPNAQAQAEKPWELSAIQQKGQGGFAVVNGQMVQVGESYSGFRLASIKNQQAVFVSKAGEKKVIGLGLSSYLVEPKPPVKTTAKTKVARPAGKKVKK